MTDAERAKSLADYRSALLKHKEVEAKVKSLRLGGRDLGKSFAKTELDLRALQSVGQIIGEVLRHLDGERYIVKASSGPRYVVGCRKKVDRAKLKSGVRVSLASVLNFAFALLVS